MEISVLKSKGYTFSVIFTGSHYYFISSWCGVAAVAVRNGQSDNFTIYYGNEHLLGGSFGSGSILPLVKRFINKSENKYIKKVCSFSAIEKPLHDASLNLVCSLYNSNEIL